MVGLVKLLLVGLGLAVALAVHVVVRRLRNPPRRTYSSAVARGQPGDPGEVPPPLGPCAFRAFTFTAPADRSGRRVELPAWEIEGRDPAGPVIICTPGWGDSKIGVLARLGAMLPAASLVVAWDPAGLGESPAWTKCNLGTDADVAALEALVRLCAGGDDGIARPIVLMGWSLGAGVSIVAAAEHRFRSAESVARIIAVIAEAPYRLAWTPARNVLRKARLPWRVNGPIAFAWLGWRLRGTVRWESFDRARFAADLPCPLLVLHGTLDDICPLDDGRAIASAARRNLFIPIEGAGHNNLWTEEPYATQCALAVRDFIAAAMRATTTVVAHAGGEQISGFARPPG